MLSGMKGGGVRYWIFIGALEIHKEGATNAASIEKFRGRMRVSLAAGCLPALKSPTRRPDRVARLRALCRLAATLRHSACQGIVPHQ